MPYQRVETNSPSFIPILTAQVVSRRTTSIVFVPCHIPPGDFPVLEPWYPHQIFESVDHRWRKAVLLGRGSLDDVGPRRLPDFAVSQTMRRSKLLQFQLPVPC